MTFLVSIETALVAKGLVTKRTWNFFWFGMCAVVLFQVEFVREWLVAGFTYKTVGMGIMKLFVM